MAVFIPDTRAKAEGREKGSWRRRKRRWKREEEGSLGT